MNTLPGDLGDSTRREIEMACVGLPLPESKSLKKCIPERMWVYLDTGFRIPEVNPPDIADIHTVG
jgi:hypothetical protein